MRITHTKDSLKLTEFAEKYPGWHTYDYKKSTIHAANRANELGAVILNKFHQFKYARNLIPV